MKKILIVAVMIFITVGAVRQGRAQDTSYIYGINWMNMGATINFNAVKKMFNDSIQFNVYHMGYGDDTISPTSKYLFNRWTDSATKAKFMVIHSDGTGYIQTYSGAERMKYEAIPIGNALPQDTANHFYFLNHPSAYGGKFPTKGTPTHWEISASTTSHSDVVVLNGNQFPTSWRDGTGRNLDIAIKLQVASGNLSDTTHVIDVVVKWYHGGTYTTLRTYGVPHSKFTALNQDFVFFDTTTFHFSSDFAFNSDSLLVEVHSTRYVDTRIAWVTIEDNYAHALLAATSVRSLYALVTSSNDIPTGATYTYNQLTTASATADSLVQVDTSAIRAAMNASELGYYYMRDEPPISEYTCMGRVNQLINRRGTTEVQADYPSRYIALVQPKYFYWAGWTGVGAQVCTSLDSGGVGYAGYDSCGVYNPVAHDTDYSCYTRARILLLQKYKTSAYGYFPSHSDANVYWDSSYINAQRYATSTNYSPLPGTTSDTNFDPYELREGAFTSDDVGSIYYAARLDSILKADTLNGSWWANLFPSAHIWKPYAFYKGNLTGVPEQWEVLSNDALATGARGLLYFTGPTSCCDDNNETWNTGFANDTGEYQTDTYYYNAQLFGGGDTLPTFPRRNTLALVRYGKWLRNYAQELYNKTFMGAFSRHGYEKWDYAGTDSSVYRGIADTNEQIMYYGQAPIVDTSADVMSRPMVNSSHWPSSITNDASWKGFHRIYSGDTLVTADTLPKTLRWLTYGFFTDTSSYVLDKNSNKKYKKWWLMAVNNWNDSRDLLGRWVEDADTGVFLRRGTRTISTKMKLDPSVSQFYKVTVLDSTQWDTTLLYNGTLTQTYAPGQGRIYRIEPTNITVIDNNGVSFNNAAHMVKHDSLTVRITYVRHDSVFARRIIGDSVVAEKLICRGGKDSVTWNDSTNHFTAKNRNPAIARHRGGVNEDMIVWERVDSGSVLQNEIVAAVLDDNDNIISTTVNNVTPKLQLRGSFIDVADVWETSPIKRTSSGMSFLETPSICGTDSGWVIAWSDSTVWTAAVGGMSGNYYANSDSAYLSLNAPHSHLPSQYPSIAWGTEALSPFSPLVHVVWQQPDTTNFQLIWHQTIEIAPQRGLTQYLQRMSYVDSVYLVTPRNDAWLCENTMPDVAVDARIDTSMHPNFARNYTHIMWHSRISNDSLQYDRVRYRERYRDSAYGPIYSWASGKRGYLEPSVFVAPTDQTGYVSDVNKTDSTLVMVWYSTLNTMHAYIPGEAQIRNFPQGGGKHVTLSYALWNDMIPEAIFQTPDSVYLAGIATHDQYDPSNTQSTQKSRQLNSLGVEGKHPAAESVCETCCHDYALWIGFAGNNLPTRNYPNPSGPYLTIPLPPIDPTPQYSGNGVNENKAIQSDNMPLQMGVPIAFNRHMTVTDSGSLANLLSTGQHPQELIELVDSATTSVLAVLDSFTVFHPTDNIDRNGTIVYYPTATTAGKTAYVRARILADSNVAVWNLVSEMQFEYADTLGPLPAPPSPYIDNGGVSYTNGVHMVRHDGTTSRIVYIRNDSLFTRRVVNDTLSFEILVSAGRQDTDLCSGGYIRAYNRNPVVARHRASVNEDMIAWEETDSASSGLRKEILVTVINDQDSMLFPTNTCLHNNAWDISNGLTTPTLTFPSMPSICGTDSGWIVAWSDSSDGIYVNTVGGKGGIYYPNVANPLLLNASAVKPALFPSIAWGNDTVSGGSGFTPMAHIVWQQPDSAGFFHIWHETFMAAPFYSSQPSLTYGVDSIEKVSERDDPWVSSNTMPSVSVDGKGNRMGNNVVRIIWHAQALSDTSSYDRVRYRERRGTKQYSATYGYASGARGYIEPDVAMSPADTTGSSLTMAWQSSTNGVYEFIPGQTVLHSYKMTGEHPTLSYSTWKDTLPSLICQTPDSAYKVVVAGQDSISGTTLSQTRQVNTVAIEALKTTIGNGSRYHGMAVSIADNHIAGGSVQTISLASLPTTTVYTGGGTNENTAVRSNNFILHTGTTVVFDRWLVAKDTATLSKILATGVHPKAYIEIVDSATSAVIAVLDSFSVSHPTDSTERKGTLAFSPSSGLNLHHAYIRARITADSNAAKWDVTSEMQFETSDTVGSGFYKQIQQQQNSLVPATDNVLRLDVHPNPFTSLTDVSFTVPNEDANGVTEVKVYDVTMREVTTLVREVKSAGQYTVTFDGSSLPSGRYVVVVRTANHLQNKLMVLEK
jgi:hypothetical protein